MAIPRWVAIFSAFAMSGAMAQTVLNPPPANVVNLSATGEMSVPQDLLTLSLRATREGDSAAWVQKELKAALDKALSFAKAAEKPELMEVRTEQFSLYPRYGKEGRIAGWQGSAELLLEGRDFALVSSTAGGMTSMSMASASFSLSRQARQRLEKEVQAMAIERFQERAREMAKGFGFAGYTLREISVSAADNAAVPFIPRAMAMEAKMSSDAPIPVAEGKTLIQVNVTGSIQLR
ncbi:MAG: SIMPL domain-containing protein [Hydrogenophaga sp.]|nr:SIMPL domain-containing protein [Hydrogenophaga sp.]